MEHSQQQWRNIMSNASDTGEKKFEHEASMRYLKNLLSAPEQELHTMIVGYSDHGCTVRLLTTKSGDIYEITSAVARVLGNRVTTKGAMMFRGKGTNPAEQIARSLEWKLWGSNSKREIRARAL
jgi:hypothetical protein